MNAAERRREILDQIAAAATLARRGAADIQLIAVSKTRTADQIEDIIAAGQRDFGESRVQEAQAKWPALLARHADVRLHCIGRLQSNKAAEAVKLFEADLNRQPYTAGLDALVVSPANARKQLTAFIKQARRQLLIYDPEIADRQIARRNMPASFARKSGLMCLL